jgi:hypothetical protein
LPVKAGFAQGIVPVKMLRTGGAQGGEFPINGLPGTEKKAFFFVSGRDWPPWRLAAGE